jgi:hypothetical protein
MRQTHITGLLDEKPLTAMSEGELAAVHSHIAVCSHCHRSYQAARVSAGLIRARAAETVDVEPFFKTRVMAALRERGLSSEPSALVRMWSGARALISTMAAIVVILIGLTIFSRGSQVDLSGTQDLYSTESVIFQQSDAYDEAPAYDQVLATMYDVEEPDEQQR